MLGRPFVDGHQRLREAPPERRQRILDPRGHLGVDRPCDEPSALEGPERAGQDLLRDLADLVVDLAVATRATREQVQDLDGPFAGEQLQGGPGTGDHLVVGGLPDWHRYGHARSLVAGWGRFNKTPR